MVKTKTTQVITKWRSDGKIKKLFWYWKTRCRVFSGIPEWMLCNWHIISRLQNWGAGQNITKITTKFVKTCNFRHFGPTLAPFWARSGSRFTPWALKWHPGLLFGSHLAALGPLWTPMGSILVPLGLPWTPFWLAFRSLWAPFGPPRKRNWNRGTNSWKKLRKHQFLPHKITLQINLS